ncbi:hypothetical protein KW797_01495 [Candidatus Parcubacteria bacterium]|nr:hypothetical protein [Candidatus Parcubacteria bacterium]
MWGLNRAETKLLSRLKTPSLIQEYLNRLPANFETKGETCMSPRRVMRQGRAHCIEGALFAALALAYRSAKPLVIHFAATDGDEDHVIAVYKEDGRWGAISKSNHAILRGRDPVYASIRELALSYFHEYYEYKTGKKSLLGYTKPINLKRFGIEWATAEEELFGLNDALYDAPHIPIVPRRILSKFRRADPIEMRMIELTQWKKK